MGAKVEEIIKGSVQALLERDSDLAKKMIQADRRINQLEKSIDQMCLQILARRQPVASDLRFITIAMKLVTDLERICDLSVNFCERILELNDEPPLKPYVDLPRMAEEAQEMVHDALDAFVEGDADKANEVIRQDAIVDAYYMQIFRELLTYMLQDQATIEPALDLILISRHLERIGDHATNIAEDVIFMVSARDVRHQPVDPPGSGAQPR
jgi:phosphate transport system protein